MTEITAPIHHIIGPTILLGSGTYFDFDNPEGSELTIEDVAYGLAFQSRFSGQCVSRRTGKRVYYSVAQHCIIMACYAASGSKMAALMHEVGEATCGDMSSPLKSKCPDYKAVEKRCEAAGLTRFRVRTPSHTYIKHLDLCMLATEQRDLMPSNGHTWGTVEGRQPFEAEIFPWENPHVAAETFLETYHQLRRSGQ